MFILKINKYAASYLWVGGICSVLCNHIYDTHWFIQYKEIHNNMKIVANFVLRRAMPPSCVLRICSIVGWGLRGLLVCCAVQAR
jgi:hypothetical protein